MQSIEKQMEEILRRKEIYQELKELRHKIVLESCLLGGSVLMLVLAVAFLPRLGEDARQYPILLYGSSVLELPVAGYVVNGLLCFILGVSLALLCQHGRMYRKKEGEIHG